MSSKSQIHYQLNNYYKEIKNGQMEEKEQSIFDGSKGLTFKFFSRKGDAIEKYVGRKNEDGTYSVAHIVNNQKSETTLNLEELLSELRNNRNFDFILNYLSEKQRSTGRIQNLSRPRKSRRLSRKLSRNNFRNNSRDRRSRRSRYF